MKQSLSRAVSRLTFALAFAFCAMFASTLVTRDGLASDPITLSAGTEATQGTIYYEHLNWLAREMADRTDGRIKIDVFGEQKLGTEISMVEGARAGSVDLVIVGGANFASFVPELQLLSVPYIFPDHDTYLKSMAPGSEPWSLIQKYADDKNLGIKVVAPTTIGSRWVANSKGEVRRLDDFRELGLRMRVQANPTEARVWSTYGAFPVSMPMPDVYTAARQGVVNAVENSPDIIANYGIHEVLPRITPTKHSFYVALLVMSDKAWNNVPDDLKPIVLETLQDSGKYALGLGTEYEARAVEKMKAAGAEIASNVDTESFREPILPLQDEVANRVGAEALLKAIRDQAK